jgi:hypothetical protein
VKPLSARRGRLCPPTCPAPPAHLIAARGVPLLILLVALWSSACGVQAPPHPPRIEQPERVTDLAIVQVGRSLRLSFTLPRNATDGERLTKPQKVEILRAFGSARSEAPSSAGDLKLWRTLSSEEVERLKHGERIAITIPFDETLRPPVNLRLALRTVTYGFRNRPHPSDVSSDASLALLEVPEALQGLQATVTEKAIQLTWQPPSHPAAGFRVYRSTASSADSFRLVGEPSEPAYNDSDFEFGHSYFYKVSATVKAGGSTASSDESQVIAVIPQDKFPPQAPRGLTALYTIGAVELIWNASSEADLRGYFVYRREGQLSETRLTPEPLSTPIFRDVEVPAGRNYTYRVTAVDVMGNESSFSEEATAEVP